MPTKKKPLRDLPKIPKELLEQFGEGLMTAEAIEDASAAFKKALI
ncbi:IS256 family transposase, partial [Pseudomonas putida]|nr:IS256 family transposase [Pseudomonas putida]